MDSLKEAARRIESVHEDQRPQTAQPSEIARTAEPTLTTVCCFAGTSFLVAWLVFLGSNIVHLAKRGEGFFVADVAVSWRFILISILMVGFFSGSLLHYVRVRCFSLKTMLADALVYAAGATVFMVGVLLDFEGDELFHDELYVVALYLCGVGSSHLCAAYFQKFYECFKTDVSKFLLMSIAAGTVVGGLFSFGDWSVREALGCVLPAMALGPFLALIHQERKGPSYSRPTASESDKRDRVDRSATVPVLATGFAGGFAYWFVLSTAPSEHVSIACVAAVAFPALVWLFCAALDYLVKESLVAKMILPFYAILFLLYFANRTDISFWASFGIIAFSIFSTLLSLCAICKHALLDDLLVSRFMDRLIMQLSASALVGSALASIIRGIPTSSFSVAMIFVVATLIVVLSVVARKNTWPGEEALLCYDSATCPMRSISPSRIVTFGDQPRFGGRFLQKCDAISKEYGLTDRQREILVFLAKGRNAEHISRELTISPYTVKTHIYNVFQKVGVHSHQELIDIVEDWLLD